MGLTIALLSDAFQPHGKLRMSVVDITFDSSYPSGGYSIDPREVGLSAIYGMKSLGGSLATLGIVPAWYQSGMGGKLLVNAGFSRQVAYQLANVRGAPVELAAAENADQAFTGGPTNYGYIGSSETFTTMAGHALAKSHTISVQPDVPRNIVIAIINDSGGSLNLFEGITTFTVTGKFRGATTTETITFTSTAGNKAIVSNGGNNARWKAGVKPWDSITSIVYDNGAAATLKCAIGLGLRFGLPSPLLTASYTEALKIWFGLPSTTADADVAIATGRIVSTRYFETFNIGDPTSQAVSEYMGVGIKYRSSPEAQVGTDLSAYTVRAEFLGI